MDDNCGGGDEIRGQGVYAGLFDMLVWSARPSVIVLVLFGTNIVNVRELLSEQHLPALFLKGRWLGVRYLFPSYLNFGRGFHLLFQTSPLLFLLL